MKWRRSAFGLFCLFAGVLLVTFVAAAVLIEGATHPLRIGKGRASDCATLAANIARETGSSAQKVTIQSSDGSTLNAWWLSPLQPGERAVLICHGIGDTSAGGLGFARLFLTHGYSVLIPDSRGHGESGGFVTYGVLEANDVVRWLNWMTRHGVREEFGFGESLGAAILIQSLPKGANFRAIVAECSYSSFESIARERVARQVPGLLASLLVKEGVLYMRLRYGVNLADARPDVAIRQVRVPVLLIHGLADDRTSPENSIRLTRENPGMTQLWLVPGARHTGAYSAAPAAFEERVLKQFTGQDY
jgi:dipeptidyl aminopeptidase/acylaminoacyl peptidase